MRCRSKSSVHPLRSPFRNHCHVFSQSTPFMSLTSCPCICLSFHLFSNSLYSLFLFSFDSLASSTFTVPFFPTILQAIPPRNSLHTNVNCSLPHGHKLHICNESSSHFFLDRYILVVSLLEPCSSLFPAITFDSWSPCPCFGVHSFAI